MRPLNRWLPQAIGLLAAATTAVLSTAPHAYSWPKLLAASALIILLTSLSCAAAMFLTGTKTKIGSTSAAAAFLAPLVILLRQTSMWAPIVAALLVWTIAPTTPSLKPQWKKFAAALIAAILLQIGIGTWLAELSIVSALVIGLAAAPVLWRIRQERNLRGPFRPGLTAAIALFLTILSLTHYLPHSSGTTKEGTHAKTTSDGKKPPTKTIGLTSGGKYRGVILSPEEEAHVILVPPIPMMGRDPFRLHKDPLGIPFFGVYWFFQAPDRAPDEDAYRVKGSPDNISFRSADFSPLKMEAHQNLGRLIDVKACSRIDIVIRNADIIAGSLAMELILVNTAIKYHPFQSLGQVPITSQAGSRETLSFAIPETPKISQFDELTIRFSVAHYRATKSPKIAIDRFFLVPP